MFGLPAAIGLAKAFTSTPGTQYINSLQNISITIPAGATSATQTISSVNTSLAALMQGGYSTTSSAAAANKYMPRIELTNSTTVTAYRDTSDATVTVTAKATVVEFTAAAVVSVQYGTIAFSTTQTTNTATISSVTAGNSNVACLGHTNNIATFGGTSSLVTLALTNGTTVTATRNVTSGNTLNIGFMVIQWQPGIINSIQKRSITLTGTTTTDTDTITSVNTSNTMLFFNGTLTSTPTLAATLYYVALTGSTSVNLVRSTGTSATRTVDYTVVEFISGVLSSVQRNISAFGVGVAQVDNTISAVNASKAFGNYCGSQAGGTTMGTDACTAYLTSTTNLRTDRGATSNLATSSWEAINFSN